jgi:hypothetical protein
MGASLNTFHGNAYSILTIFEVVTNNFLLKEISMNKELSSMYDNAALSRKLLICRHDFYLGYVITGALQIACFVLWHL